MEAMIFLKELFFLSQSLAKMGNIKLFKAIKYFSALSDLTFQFDDFLKKKIEITTKELIEERDMAMDAVKD
jgi:hypothetical protein